MSIAQTSRATTARCRSGSIASAARWKPSASDESRTSRRADELTDREQDELVLYPSGLRFALRGVFVSFALDGLHFGKGLFLLDPRAVIVRNALIIRDPRSHPATFPEMHAWFVEHPEWARLATEAL